MCTIKMIYSSNSWELVSKFKLILRSQSLSYFVITPYHFIICPSYVVHYISPISSLTFILSTLQFYRLSFLCFPTLSLYFSHIFLKVHFVIIPYNFTNCPSYLVQPVHYISPIPSSKFILSLYLTITSIVLLTLCNPFIIFLP